MEHRLLSYMTDAETAVLDLPVLEDASAVLALLEAGGKAIHSYRRKMYAVSADHVGDLDRPGYPAYWVLPATWQHPILVQYREDKRNAPKRASHHEVSYGGHHE